MSLRARVDSVRVEMPVAAELSCFRIRLCPSKLVLQVGECWGREKDKNRATGRDSSVAVVDVTAKNSIVTALSTRLDYSISY